MRTRLYMKHLETPLGEMVMLASDKGICGFEFVDDDLMILLNRKFRKYFSEYEIQDTDHPEFWTLKTWTIRYFDRDFQNLKVPSLDMIGTEFERAVRRVLLEIPAGEVTTYGKIAKQIGCNSARAIGGSVGRNPFAMVVPCHRVIGKTNALTGYGGGLDRKQWLLKHEGFTVHGNTRDALVTHSEKGVSASSRRREKW